MRGTLVFSTSALTRRRDLGRQAFDALEALTLRAELFVKPDRLEPSAGDVSSLS